MRVLVFGDSIVQGYWDTEGGWVARLRRFYDEQIVKDLRRDEDYPSIFNLGISGGNSQTILDRFSNEVKARKNTEPLAVIICTGVNDSYLEHDKVQNTSPEDYELNLRELAKKAKELADKTIFIGLIAGDESQTLPVFWRDIYYYNDRIKQYEDIMGKVAQSQGAGFIPVHDEFKKHLAAGKDLLADGLHPNNEGHQFIYEIVRPELDKLL